MRSRRTRAALLALVAAVAPLVVASVAAAPPSRAAGPTDVRINEVESNGDTIGDFTELKNTGTSPVDISGWKFRDNDAAHAQYAVPANTVVQPGGYYVVTEAAQGFGLGSNDSVTLWLPDGTTVVDTYAWTAHASTTYGRCPDGTGAFTTTAASTRGVANSCGSTPPGGGGGGGGGDLATQPWPGGAEVSTVDPQGTFASNLSGLAYEGSGSAAPGTLWAVRNGPGALFRLAPTPGGGYAPAGGDWASGKLLRYADGTGDVDAEGLTFTAAGPAGGAYVASERNNAVNTVSRPAVLRYAPATAGTELRPTNDWNLTSDLPGLGPNLGLEAIAWVPDAYLTRRGFVDENTRAPYDPARYAGHGAGLFLVGVEQTGRVYVYALDQTGNGFTRVASFASGFSSVMELHFEVESQKLWVVCDDTCQGRSGLFDVDASGVFAAQTYYERPAGMPNLNNEGFTTTPQSECAGGRKPVYWADDGSTDGYAVRRGTLRCTPAPSGAPTDTTVPDVRVTGVRDGATYRLGAPRPRCAATDAGSGVASCRLTTTRRGLRTVVTATATDRAGNTARASATWRRPQVRVAGAVRVARDGRYVVRRGDVARVVALLDRRPAPRLLGPARDGQRLPDGGRKLRRGGSEGGLTTWVASIRPDGPVRDRRLAVRVGGRRIVVGLRVLG